MDGNNLSEEKLEQKLEHDLTGDFFLSLDKATQHFIVTQFLDYLDLNRLAVRSPRNRYILTDLFLKAVTTGNPLVISPMGISQALRTKKEMWVDFKEKDFKELNDADYADLNRRVDDMTHNLASYNPRHVLEAMRSIFAYITPGSMVKPGFLTTKRKPQKIGPKMVVSKVKTVVAQKKPTKLVPTIYTPGKDAVTPCRYRWDEYNNGSTWGYVKAYTCGQCKVENIICEVRVETFEDRTRSTCTLTCPRRHDWTYQCRKCGVENAIPTKYLPPCQYPPPYRVVTEEEEKSIGH